jgi:hypothetical protein
MFSFGHSSVKAFDNKFVICNPIVLNVQFPCAFCACYSLTAPILANHRFNVQSVHPFPFDSL